MPSEPASSADNPILNNPYEEPDRHYATNDRGELDYADVRPGRRIFTPDAQVIPIKQGPDRTIFEINDFAAEFAAHQVNLIRREVGHWRAAGYPGVTRVTGELLTFWFNNPERPYHHRLFFAQQEAIETAIWLNEVAGPGNAGQHVLETLQAGRLDQMAHGGESSILPRIAFKMATGTGKTVVMAALILYHFFNRQEYHQDTRFADNFLLVTPGITIRDRLAVLFPNKSRDPATQDYYHARDLVPRRLEPLLDNLNARISITNFHAFEPRTLQGNKRSPFDGKLDAAGKKQEAREDFALVAKRVMGGLKEGKRLLILNDEAHHCYLPRGKGSSAEGEDTREENARAAVWFSGLVQLAKRYKVGAIYDLSATPYYLSGSGFEPYSLFPWVVSDFGLIEAIESGLVKIPFLPESDETQELSMPVLRNLYEFVRDELPRKGQRTARAEARKAGKESGEEPPQLPSRVKAALEMFYRHYEEEYRRARGIFDNPPVFIVVCNNTSVSKEVYKYVAGYERRLSETETGAVSGHLPLFSNYDPNTFRALAKPPTLLIDSDSLENSDQVNDEFRKVFATEIELFKRDYARLHGQGSLEDLTDAHILREVVNTVGKTGMLGAHVRCVVSVSMLTEGWDANTVTHIMGLRAFGSQLLCEQVAGRALRRKNYELEALDARGNPVKDWSKAVTIRFPPEYAHIIGVPFRMFKGGTAAPPPPQSPRLKVFAVPDREAEMEITFPNVVGYRVERREGPVEADFSKIEPLEIDFSHYPLNTLMGNAFSPDSEKLTLAHLLEKRDQEVIYQITAELLRSHYRDDGGCAQFQRFNQLRRIVEEWYGTRVKLVGSPDPGYRKALLLEAPERICSHIMRGVMASQRATDVILPVLNFYNSLGSTRYVRGDTTREVCPTCKSHVNLVVADTESWEQIAAKTLEEIEAVECYVKNAFLGFTIPYVDGNNQDRLYFPDFIARCQTPDGQRVNLVIEVTGMNRDKAEKIWYVENRWLPAINAVREKYGWDEWRYIEVASDIREIKNQLIARIQEKTHP